MDRMFVITAITYRPTDTDGPPTRVTDLGFSLVRLMQLSGADATGVRANLQITNQAALNDLAHHYSNNTRLEWSFEIGGGGGSFSVVLRWTKLDRPSGTLQIVRTAVLRDLISEAESTQTDASTSSNPDGDPGSEETNSPHRQPRIELPNQAPPQSTRQKNFQSSNFRSRGKNP